MEPPKISIIIPAYNREDLLRKALDSVPISKNYQIILINDGSTDKTSDIMLDWFGAKRKLFHGNSTCSIHFINKGVAFAMNEGFDLATGEYIVSLSSDDYYVRDFSEFMPYLDGKNDLVYFDLEINDGTIWHLDEESKKVCVGAVKFIRREFLGDTRVPNLKYKEDLPFSNQLYAKNPKEVFTGIVLKHYNFPHEGSLSWQAEEEERKKG